MDTVALEAAELRSSDGLLVERHLHGDPQAFEEIYSRFGSSVFGLALRLTGDRELAADLTQETFLRIFRHLPGFKGRSSLKTWVNRVTVNCCRSRLKRRGGRRRWILPASDGEADPERLADTRPDPEEKALSSGTRRELASLLVRLPMVYREAVVLRDLQGLSYDEIATVLGIRIGTVRSRIARGRRQLRTMLEKR